MKQWQHKVDCPERMIEAIRHYGIIPFFRCGIPGWSIEELTPAECWFASSDNLGPWDWKIEVLHEGDIAYGKYLRRKAGFATREFYGHLMNWRRSQPQFQMPISPEKCPVRTADDRLMQLMAPAALQIIRERDSVESGELRTLLEDRISLTDRQKISGHLSKYLVPKIKKQAIDFLLQYLEMGTWTLIGDFRRVYRGPNLVYSGWQRASFTTPDSLFGDASSGAKTGTAATRPDAAPAMPAASPFWARFIEEPEEHDKADAPAGSLMPDCTPEESLDVLRSHISGFFPGCIKELDRLLL